MIYYVVVVVTEDPVFLTHHPKVMVCPTYVTYSYHQSFVHPEEKVVVIEPSPDWRLSMAAWNVWCCEWRYLWYYRDMGEVGDSYQCCHCGNHHHHHHHHHPLLLPHNKCWCISLFVHSDRRPCYISCWICSYLFAAVMYGWIRVQGTVVVYTIHFFLRFNGK